MIKNIVKKFTPSFLLRTYHWLLAWVAAIVYRFPSEKLIVIGVTGTNGKSTSVSFIGQLLEGAGLRVGWTSTASFKIGDKEWLNDTKMTMLGRFALQKMLATMVKDGCKYAIIETSSQGIEQFRHLGINYDMAVFTNLTPEHIESHGGFDNYKQAKGKLFAKLAKDKKKKIGEQEIDKKIIANIDDKHAEYFLNFDADKKVGFGIQGEATASITPVIAKDIQETSKGSSFVICDTKMELNILGNYNLYNALAAISVCMAEGVKIDVLAPLVSRLVGVPGRLEWIDEGQDFDVLVDYAPEPVAMEELYSVVAKVKKGRLIHVLGSAGGGRDIARRPILGKMAGEQADIIVVTNEDPYDDDPMEIINQVAKGAVDAGKTEGVNLFKVLDRGEAISKAIGMAKSSDIVLITGKGCEQAMCLSGGKKIPWDDRRVVRQAIRQLGFETFN